MDDRPHHSERYLYDLWERHAATGLAMRARGGERIVVISPGHRNDSTGPDYLDAVLLIDGILTAGAVEMHVSESDWFAHGHHLDIAYQQVILHLLAEAPAHPRLSVPTILGADLGGSVPVEAPRYETASLELSAEMVADLSWGRLLRRATEIMRTEIGDDPVADLRRAFLRRLFDCLGYSRNRAPMKLVAAHLLEHEAMLPEASFDATVRLIVQCSGISPERFALHGRSFMSESRLTAITHNVQVTPEPLHWRNDTRPANAPERRLWGAAKLTFDLYHNRLLGRLLEALMAGKGEGELIRLLTPRFGRETFIGTERAAEIIVNAVTPVAVAAGIVLPHPRLLQAACWLYRLSPSRGSNRIVRQVEGRYLGGRELRGAFWQQGAIEFHQRYLSTDRRALSMVAEARGGWRTKVRG